MSEPEQIRASDSDRERAVARLGSAVGEGRLTLTEFSDRVDRAYAARTQGELVPLTADLPTTAAPPTAPARTSWVVSPIGGEARKGRWLVPARSIGISGIGGAALDLTDAEFAAPVVELTRWSLIGGISLRVPPGVRVEVSGISVIGGHSVSLPDPAPGAPTLRVRLFSLIGGVSVRSSRR